MRADLLFELCGQLFRHAPRETPSPEIAVNRASIGAFLDIIPNRPVDGRRKCVDRSCRIELSACNHVGQPRPHRPQAHSCPCGGHRFGNEVFAWGCLSHETNRILNAMTPLASGAVRANVLTYISTASFGSSSRLMVPGGQCCATTVPHRSTTASEHERAVALTKISPERRPRPPICGTS